MASTIYPNNRGLYLSTRYEQARKLLYMTGNTKASLPNGYIIAKGNIIEGIEAKD